MTHAFDAWWEPTRSSSSSCRRRRRSWQPGSTLLDSFVSALTPVGLLDRFQVAGVIASWWGDIQFDLRALAAGGFSAVVDGWVTTITTALDDKTAQGQSA